ncbi:MAG: sigma-54-dependent Fis family transcriptional regulator [Oligoflexia bacterium]|nr:sigma-54-dependent Fis family transcriptional regulator [Oligoflexia bacterium]
MLKVLVVDDDQALRESVKAALSSTGKYIIDEAADGLQAVAKVRAGDYSLVFLDVDMPNLNGLDALKFIKEHDPAIIVIVLTAYSNVNDAVRAVKEGAYNYISKPVKQADILEMTKLAFEAHDIVERIAASAPSITLEGGQKFVSSGREMQKVFNIIFKLSKVNTPVLIRGESGTGKEMVAKAIHLNSERKNQKMVAINCSAIPETLFESELFGHEKGSFTGADQRKIGKFQYAEGGTLFLDEVGDLSPAMQVKLLRVLQEKKFTPVGSNREIESDVRIIAATNRNLEEMIKGGLFREDLFYRLNVIPVNLPPLRERKNDIDHLIELFINKFNLLHKRALEGMNVDAIAAIKKYDWPGNIRELENVIEHAFIIEGSKKITLKSLPEKITGMSDDDLDDDTTVSPEDALMGTVAIDQALDFNRQKELFEREFIIKALKQFRGRINQTALNANIPKKTLLRKIEKYSINPRDYVAQKDS